jgi:esterase/lipase superfamily enzyme
MPPVAGAPPLVDKSLRSVKLFYGTNRRRESGCAGVTEVRWDSRRPCSPDAYYGGSIAFEAASDGLEVGTVSVTFPPHHQRGRVERPLQVFRVTFEQEDPDRHVVISELRSFGADHAAWAAEVRQTGREQAFVYVHGYANSFAAAARSAAQLAYDLDFDLQEDFRGVPMLFSWPSRGDVTAYLVDDDAAEASAEAFNRFLDLVRLRTGVRRIHVIAHSMGNRLVTEALWARRESAGEPIVDQLVLAAPDVWAELFRERFLTLLPQLASRVTLYVSDHDRALTASSVARREVPRAGQVAGGVLEASRGVDRFDAVNASTLEADFLGHSYYASDRSMLGDIYCLLKGTPAMERPLLVAATAGWQFRPAGERALLDASRCLAAAASGGAGRRGSWWLALAALAGLFVLAGLVLWRLRR